MDDAAARLPSAYASFLALRRRGLADVVIADRLGLPVESLPLLGRLAEEKLASLRLETAE